MDLISREAVDNAIYDYCHSCDVNESQMENYFCELPSAFEGMTNGEVIKALFPTKEEVRTIGYYKGNGNDWYVPTATAIQIDSKHSVIIPIEWWNRPYKGVSE